MRSQLRFAFGRLPPEAREEAIQEGLASTLVAYRRLFERGRAAVARPSPLANYAIRQFSAGRITGGRLNVRDVASTACRRRHGLVVERLDGRDEATGLWREFLVEDRTCTPAELAASRIDYPAWLRTLSCRHREIALALADGGTTRDVARRFGLCPARVSQLRNELKCSWEQFHQPRRNADDAEEGGMAA